MGFIWIPVKNNVPTERGYYLACNGRGEVFIADFVPPYGKMPAMWWNITNYSGTAERVVAWSVLPEPYKEEEEE